MTALHPPSILHMHSFIAPHKLFSGLKHANLCVWTSAAVCLFLLINRKTQKNRQEKEWNWVCVCVLVWWKAGSSFSSYDDVSVSVGASVSLAFVGTASVGAMETAARSVADAALTVTEAGRWVLEVGRRGVTPWERRGGSWDGSTAGRGGNGARPGRLSGGSVARGGTGGNKTQGLIIWFCAFSSFSWNLYI